MFKALWNLEALNGESLITAISQLLDNATLVHLEDSNRLLTVVNRAHPPLIKLTLKRCLFLFDYFMWQLYLLLVCTVNFVPNEAVYILRRAPYLLIDFSNGLLALDALLVRCVDQTGQLMELITLQE